MKKYFFAIFIFCLVLSTTGAICSKSGTMPKEVTLVYWSPEHNEEDIQAATTKFNALYPYANVEFRKLNYDEYQTELISSWAKNQGPDIFSIPSTEVRQFYDYISPMPKTMAVTTVTTSEKFGKKEISVAKNTLKGYTPAQLRNEYVDTVYNDVVFPHMDEALKENKATDKIFGLPLFMDNLVLFWNRDILNQASLSLPANNWQSMVDQSTKLTRIDQEGNLIQSSIALGTTTNINHYFDILSVLMMQYGTDIVQDGSVVFDQKNESDKIPGKEALFFYTSFAQEKWETYAWNENQQEALADFASGKTAYYLGYHYDLVNLKDINPNLNFDLAALPQISQDAQVNYPNYWVESVSANSKQKDMAWTFLTILTNEENAKKYAEITKKPAARRAILAEQTNDYELSVFAQQALTAKNWYHGKDVLEAKKLFGSMIDQALVAEDKPLEDIVKDTASKVQLTY